MDCWIFGAALCKILPQSQVKTHYECNKFILNSATDGLLDI
jgi:hypothetical protein